MKKMDIEKVITKQISKMQENATEETQAKVAKVAELANDVQDAVKITAKASSGDWVGAAFTALGNKKVRKWLMIILIIIFINMSIMAILLISVINAAVDLTVRPYMEFRQEVGGIWEDVVTEFVPHGKPIVINFDTLSNQWTKTIPNGGRTGLTTAEINTVNSISPFIGLPHGLLEVFYEVGVRAGANTVGRKMSVVTKILQPNAITFKPVQLRKVRWIKTKKGMVKQYYYVTVEALENITRYNGFWVTPYQIITQSDGSQNIVYQTAILQTKNYTPLFQAEQTFNFERNNYDQQLLWAQALVLDPNFYDPAAINLLQQLEGGVASTSGGAPSAGVPIPKPQVIAILQQAIQIDHVPTSWLPYLEVIVGHEDASGNPDAVDPILVDGEHASGLMQMLPSTFRGDAVSGYNDIWNPLDNAVAAIVHIEGAWHNPANIPGVVSGVYTGY